MSNNQITPDNSNFHFDSSEKRYENKGGKITSETDKYKAEGYKGILSWDTNPIILKVARELGIGKAALDGASIFLKTGEKLPTFGAKLGQLLGEGRTELSFSFLGQLDLGFTNAMSDVLEVYNNAEGLVLPEGVTAEKLKSTIEQTILRYTKYDVKSGDVNIGVEGIKDYVSRYNELLTRASALVVLQSPNSDPLNNNKTIVGERRVQLIKEIKDLHFGGGDKTLLESKITELNENNSDKVIDMLSRWVFESSMKRISDQLEVIRGIVSLNSAINKREIFQDVRNDQKLDEQQRVAEEKEARRANFGKEGAPLGERVVRNFIILTGALRIRALPTRGENDNTDNAKDDLRIEKFTDRVQLLLRNEFNRVTLTLVSVAIFPFVATAYGIRSASESQGLKDFFEGLFGPAPEPKPDNEKIDTKDKPEPGILATKFLSFFERVLPKWKGKTGETKFIVDNGDNDPIDTKYRYLLAAIALVPFLCFTTATLESLYNRTFRNTSGLNNQIPEFPVAGQSAPIQSPASIGSVIGNTNAGTFQDPAAGDIGIPDAIPTKTINEQLPGYNEEIYYHFNTVTFEQGQTVFAALEKAGYDPISDLYNPNSKFYSGGEAAAIININLGNQYFVNKLMQHIFDNQGPNSERQYNAIKRLYGDGLPDYQEFINDPENKDTRAYNGIIKAANKISLNVFKNPFNSFSRYEDFVDIYRLVPEGADLSLPRNKDTFKKDLADYFNNKRNTGIESPIP